MTTDRARPIEDPLATVIVRATARGLTPVIAGLSLYLLVRGHNAPGGGFIAALVAGAAVSLRYLAFGYEGVRRILPVPFSTLLAAGLLVAVGVGVLGYLFEGSFLGGAIWRWSAPLIGEQKVASSLIFDVGVYLIVLAVIVAIVRFLGEDEG